MVHYQGRYEPAWTWEHYIAATNDQLDRNGRAFENKAERVKAELWVIYPREKLVNTSHSLNIFVMMTLSIVFICRIFTGARRGTRSGRRLWLTIDATNS